jgi:Spy/CpxP family protein refolding chaperone
MKSINLKAIALSMVGLLLFGSNQLFAQQGENGHHCKEGKESCCKIADLTEAQQKKIEELKATHQKNMLQYNNQLTEKEAHLQTLRTADKADMTAINKTVDEIGAIKTQILKEKENHLQLVRAQLTDSQKLQFDQQQGKHQGNGCQGSCGNCKKGMGKQEGKCHGNESGTK